MLDPWIIEEIRRREQEKTRRQMEQPAIEIETDSRRAPQERREGDADADRKPGRGVVIIDLGGSA